MKDYQWYGEVEYLKPEERPAFVKVPTYRGIFEIRDVLRTVWANGGIVCGGYVRYCASPKTKPYPAQDLDIYSPNDESFEKLKRAFAHLNIRHENAMALTLDGGRYTPDVQLIKPFKGGNILTVGDMEEILSNFDFTVVRCGLINEETALVDSSFIYDENHALLRLKNIHCPVSSTLRCIKYGKKGYWLRPFEAMKLFVDWDNRDQDYKDNLIGYFSKIGGGAELTREEVDELEALLRID